MEQLVGKVQCGHDGYPIQADHLAGVTDFAHARIEVFGGIQQRRALLVRAGDEVFLLENPDADARRFVRGQAPCSMVLRRPIMASTRPRTCSFLFSSEARSVASVSWRCRTRM